MLLKYLKCLPSELNVQLPEDIWRLLESLSDGGEKEQEQTEIPEEWRFFYGL